MLEDVVVCYEINFVTVVCGIYSSLEAIIFSVADFSEDFFISEVTNLIYFSVDCFCRAVYVGIVNWRWSRKSPARFGTADKTINA